MFSSQQVVIGWVEFTIATTILLAVTKLCADRLRQPVDRVNLITLSLITSALVPLVLIFLNVPSVRLGLFREDRIPTVVGEPDPISSALAPSLDSRSSIIPAQDISQVSPKALNDFAATITNRTEVQGSTSDSEPITAGNEAQTSSPIAPSPRVPLPGAPNKTHHRTQRNTLSAWSLSAIALVLSYVAAFAWFSLQWTIGAWQLRRLSRDAHAPSQAVQDTWQRVCIGRSVSVELQVTDQLAAPLVFGWLRPVVLIPKSLATATGPELAFCLAHEWSHVNRGDLARWQLINLCQLLVWYQPLYWLLRRELRICQDLVADDQAANCAAGKFKDPLARVEYSELLLSIARSTKSPKLASAMAFYDRSSQLSRRITALLTSEDSLRARSTRGFLWISMSLMLLASLLMGSVRLSTAAAKESTTTDPSPVAESAPSAATTPIVESITVAESELANELDTAANTEEKELVVRGQVLNEAGDPLAGAKLFLPLTWEPRRTTETATDQDGKFQFKFPEQWVGPHIRGSSWIIWASAPGYSLQSQSAFEAVRKKQDVQYTIKLPPLTSTRFKILSPTGQPLAGVRVAPQNYVTSVASEIVPTEMVDLLSGTTDSEGRVSLPGIESKLLSTITMQHPLYGRQNIRIDDQHDTERTIRLQPVTSLKGRLVAENPEWTRNVKIAFMTGNFDDWKVTQGIADVVTDAEGKFEVPIIATGGPLRTYVTLDPKLPVRPVLNDNTFLTEGETEQLDIQLANAPIVFGKVVVKSTQKPVPNAEIVLTYGGYHQHDSATTDEQGNYQARALPGDLHVQIVVLPDHLVQRGAPWAESIPVATGTDKFEIPTIEVINTREINGRLIDANDKPLPNIQVLAVDRVRRYGFGKSNNDGNFQMRVPDDVETKLEVFDEKRGSIPLEVVQSDPLTVRLAADNREKRMEAERGLKADVSVSGRVLLAGKPVSGVTVNLQLGKPVLVGPEQSPGSQYNEVSRTKTDVEGRYVLKGLKAGDEYRLEILPNFAAADPKWHHQSPWIQRLPESASGEVKLPDVNLLKLNQSIAGVVVDPDGQPVKDASISVQLRTGEHLPKLTPSGPPPWTQSDRKGRFLLKGLPDAPLSIMAYFDNPNGGAIRFPAKMEVDQNQKDIRIVLDPALREDEEK